MDRIEIPGIHQQPSIITPATPNRREDNRRQQNNKRPSEKAEEEVGNNENLPAHDDDGTIGTKIDIQI